MRRLYSCPLVLREEHKFVGWRGCKGPQSQREWQMQRHRGEQCRLWEHKDVKKMRRGRNGSMELVGVRSQKASLTRLCPVGQHLTHSE